MANVAVHVERVRTPCTYTRDLIGAFGMRFHRLLLALLAVSVLGAPVDAQRGGHRGGSTHVRGYTRRDGTHVAPYTRSAPRSYTAPRARSPTARPYRAPSTRSRTYATPNGHGRIHRSVEAKEQFLRRTGYPHGRKGYVVDHIVPLCAGGADAPSNMQWQTVEEAKVKDRQERALCARGHRP